MGADTSKSDTWPKAWARAWAYRDDDGLQQAIFVDQPPRGLPSDCEPLYDETAVDALLAAERERCRNEFRGRRSHSLDMQTMVWIIETLWTDPLENRPRDALGYRVSGVAMSKEDATKIVDLAGQLDGTGWPIKKGESIPKCRTYEVNILVPKRIVHRD